MSCHHPGLWIALLLAVPAIAGCSGTSSGPDPAAGAGPDVFPAQYQLKITRYLLTELTDHADFHGALISQPAIKPVGTSHHYVVCVQLNGHNKRKEKAVVFLSGDLTQFIDPIPEQCADAQYQPFRDLESVAPG